jgi:hypothetical protein
MRRFTIGSAKALVLLAASPAVWWCGSIAAFAQSYDAYYDFSFSGCSCSGVSASGVLEFYLDPNNLGNSTLIGISGSVSGFSNPLDNGSIQSLFGPPPSALGNQIPFTLADGTNETFILYSPITQLTTSNSESAYGPLSLTPVGSPAGAPAPALDAGLLAYLALGFAGLSIYRKRLWRAARMMAGAAV